MAVEQVVEGATAAKGTTIVVDSLATVMSLGGAGITPQQLLVEL